MDKSVSSHERRRFGYGLELLGQADNKRKIATECLSKYRWAEAAEAAIDSIEFTVKAIASMVSVSFPKEHGFDEKRFGTFLKQLLDAVPEDVLQTGEPARHWVALHDVPRVLFLNSFWVPARLLARYGFESLDTGPVIIFREKEAKLAVEHANECYLVGLAVQDLVERKRRAGAGPES